MNKKTLSERDICTKFITPALEKAGWDKHVQLLEEVSFTDGKIFVRGKLTTRGKGKRADYILYYKPNDEGKRELDNFINPEEKYPVIATTSELMTTGVDAQTCKVIVLDSNINSMTKFKQIIGRGTRINEEYGKLYFTILDFRNAADLFADPQFDGDPIRIKPVTEATDLGDINIYFKLNFKVCIINIYIKVLIVIIPAGHCISLNRFSHFGSGSFSINVNIRNNLNNRFTICIYLICFICNTRLAFFVNKINGIIFSKYVRRLIRELNFKGFRPIFLSLFLPPTNLVHVVPFY